MRIALIVEYEGTDFNGFQYQTNVPSIQEELEKAIGHLTGEHVRVTAAGRTDAGVHAKGQVVAFHTESEHGPDTFTRAINHHLPEAIAVKATYRTREDFDPRRDALSRTYQYTVYRSATRMPLARRTAFQVVKSLDVGRMREGAVLLEGTHDFRDFAGPPAELGASTLRRIVNTEVHRDGHLVTIEIEGNAFLPHMVRRIAGALVALGLGELSVKDIRSIIERRPEAPVAHTLPPHGLSLEQVKYADFPPEDGEYNGNL